MNCITRPDTNDEARRTNDEGMTKSEARDVRAEDLFRDEDVTLWLEGAI